MIGLDGATFARMDELFEAGRLPNLAALRDRGMHAELQTTLPAISPPAWTSATTGVNPGKHNIFDFMHMTPESPQPLLTSRLDRRARPVWEFLNDAGYKTGIMNVPMTFPPEPVDGFFISGFPYGSETTGFTHPPELEAELGDYPLDLFGESLQAGQEFALLERFRYTAERHVDTAKKLITEEDWNLFWVVFTGTDKVQHFYWKYGDPEHPRHDAMQAQEFGDAIERMYERMDRAVGELVELAGPDTDVVVLSDHGFGPIYRELRLTTWLRQQGYLVPAPQGKEPWIEAIAPGAFGGLLRVSQKGRDFRGQVPSGEATEAVVDRLVSGIRDLTDPESGSPFADGVYRGSDVYHGPYAMNAPDVVFTETHETFVGRATEGFDELFGLPSYTFSGFHRPQGILFAAGPNIASSPERGKYSILDVAPLIYWLFDVEAPGDLDGEFPEALALPDALDARPYRSGSRECVIPPDQVLSDADREAIEALGYVQ